MRAKGLTHSIAAALLLAFSCASSMHAISPNNFLDSDDEELGHNWAAWKDFNSRSHEIPHIKIETMAEALLEKSARPQNAITYHLECDGTISKVRVLHQSCSPLFDTICVAAVASLSGDPAMRFPHTPDISALNPVLRCYFYGTASKHHQELSEKDIYIMMKLAVDRIRTMLELKPSELRKELERLYSQ